MMQPPKQGPFIAAIEGWVMEQQELLMAVARQATQSVIEEMKKPKAAGGRMPIDTSFLQNSLQGSRAGVPGIDPQATGGIPQRGNFQEIQALIGNWKLGETLYFGFTAAYAAHQNYGTIHMEGNFFVELALQRWDEFVGIAQRRLAGELVFGGH